MRFGNLFTDFQTIPTANSVEDKTSRLTTCHILVIREFFMLRTVQLAQKSRNSIVFKSGE